jgi:hypothetical protein
MEVETLGKARSLGWKVHMRCSDGHREARSPSGDAFIGGSSTMTLWFAHADRTSRFRGWNRGSCVQPVEVAPQGSCSSRLLIEKSAAGNRDLVR